MKFSVLVSLFAVTAFGAVAAAPVDGDVLFVRALEEKDPARKAETLLTLAERGKYPAELALIHLTRVKLPPKSLARLLPIARFRIGEIVPTVLLVRSFRAECDSSHPEPMPRNELFNLVHAAWKNSAMRQRSEFEQALFRELSGEVMTLAWECGETKLLFPEVERYLAAHRETWDRDLPLTRLLEFCYRHAFVNDGFELYSDAWEGSPVASRRLFAELLGTSLKRLPESDDDALARMNFLIAMGKGDMAFMLAMDRLNSADSDDEMTARKGQVIYAMIETGSVDILRDIEPKLNPALLPLIKAQTLIAAGRAREALPILAQVADPAQRAELKLRCCFALGEFDRAVALSGDPAEKLPEDLRILTLLSAAEILNDQKCYDTAARFAGNKIDTSVSLSNSFGYTAVLLGLDRDLAEKRIKYALSIRPRESGYLDSLAWARYKAGDYAGAWKHMEEALRYCDPEPEECEILEHAGAIRLALGDREGARRYCEQALKLALAGEKDPKRGFFFRKYVADIRKLLEQLK